MSTGEERAGELRRAYDESVVQEGKELAGPFMTVSSMPIERLYDPTDLAAIDYERDINLPGSYPFTRGVHKTGYRG
jgi:methylmalonyl-CoA mutase N-terminal domain/subunit